MQNLRSFGMATSVPREDVEWINAGDVDQFIGIEDAEPSIVELDDAFVTKAGKDTIDVHAREPSGVGNVFLRQRQTHFVGTVARPLQAVADEKLKQ